MNVNEVITERIIKGLETGTAPWRKPWVGGRTMNAINKIPYSGINAILTHCSNFKSPFYLTANQCKKIGATWSGHGTPITFWSILDKVEKEDEKEKIKKIFILKYYTVWNLEQITLPEGFKLPEEVHFQGDPVKEGDRYLEQFPIKYRVQDRAYYSPGNDEIVLPERDQFKSVPLFYATAFHECTHATGHPSRLNRDLENFHGGQDYAFEELIAEIGASFTMNSIGLLDETIENATAYCKGWITKLQNNPTWIVKAAGKADKAFKFIIGEKEESCQNVA